MTIRRGPLSAIATAVVLTAVAISFAVAQAPALRPNFSGTWILDAARSDTSTFTPESATWSVVQRGDSIVLDRASPGTGPQHAVYALGGSPRTNMLRLVGSGTSAVSAVSWQVDTMVVRTVSHPGDGELIQVDHWWLAGPRDLRIRREAAYQGRSMGAPTFVFTRHP